MRTDAPFKTMEDVRNAKEPPKCGATGTGTTGFMVPRLLDETIGAKFNVITGYKGGNEVDLAVERGEIQCRAFSVTAFFAREPFHTWRKNNFARAIIQNGQKRDSRLADVPTLNELMEKYKTPEISRRVALVVTASEIFQRPYMGPPGLRPELVQNSPRSVSEDVEGQRVFGRRKKQEARCRVHFRRRDGNHGQRNDVAAARGCRTIEESVGKLGLASRQSIRGR